MFIRAKEKLFEKGRHSQKSQNSKKSNELTKMTSLILAKKGGGGILEK